MDHLSTTMNTCQPRIFLSNTIYNPKNDRHRMEINTQGGKHIIYQPISSKEHELSQKVVQFLGPQLQYLYILVNKT